MKNTAALKTLLMGVLALSVGCGPSMKEATPHSSEHSSEIYETFRMDDMILFRTKESLRPQGNTGFRHYNFVYKPWPGGVMKVILPTEVGSISMDIFKKACSEWEQASGVVRCEYISEVPHNEPYLNVTFKKDEGCYSYLGAHVQNKETHMNLGNGCWNIGTIKHELGHAFGLMHEHQRSDRDNYITIIDKDSFPHGESVWKSSFEKIDNGDELLTPYDFDSIMHYNRRDPVTNIIVITPLPQYADRMHEYEGIREKITPLDAESLRIIYKGNNSPGNNHNNGGFDPMDFENNPEFDRSSCPSEKAKKLTNGLYLGLFFRKADFPGADGYCHIIHREGPTGLARIAKAMQTDPNGEWRERSRSKTRIEIVTNLYRSFFGRNPDESGFKEYVEGNYTYERIIEILIQSREFSCRYGYPITQPNSAPCGS